MKFSDQERRILRALQRDASASMAELAEAVGIGASTVWRRVQELQKSGVIRGRVAVLDPRKAGLDLCVFAQVALVDHSEAAIDELTAIVRRHPEIMEAHSLSGADDYILKIRCKDVASYEAFLTENLLRSKVVRSITSTFSLRQLKETTELPL